MTEGVRRPTAILLSIGDELLVGRTVNTNASWLGAALADLGLPVRRVETLADDDDAIASALRRAIAEEPALIVLTGGLGPTPDDHTREAVAEALGVALRPHPAVQAHLDRFYEGRDGTPAPANVAQVARVPEGGEVTLNPRGTAPAIRLRHGATTLLLLPGVPREMRALFEELAPALRPLAGTVAVRLWATTGIPESRLAPRVESALEEAGIRERVDGHPWALAYLPNLRGVGLRATVEGLLHDAAEALLARVAEVLDPLLQPWRIPDAASGELVRAVADGLRARGWRMATAESCTGGLVAKRCTDEPGSSAWFEGSVVAYANAVKLDALGVDPGAIEVEGAVSEVVAREMVEGVTSRFGVEAGVALTGIAGPEGGTPEKPVGLVYWAVRAGDRLEVRRHRFHGDREAVRERAAQAALADLYRLLEEDEPQ